VSQISEAALASPTAPQPPGPSDLLLQWFAVQFTDGHAARAPILKEVLAAFGASKILSHGQARWLWFAGDRAALWDNEAWTALSTRHLDLVREAGALTALPFVLTNRNRVSAFLATWATPQRMRRSCGPSPRRPGSPPSRTVRSLLCEAKRPSSRSWLEPPSATLTCVARGLRQRSPSFSAAR
jgi:hypothetical protein